MKAKTIKKLLAAKVDSLASHVELSTKAQGNNPPAYFDAGLPKAIRKEAIITGGCIVSMLQREPVNDYDLYFRTRGVALRVARFFLWQFLRQNDLQVDAYIELEDPRYKQENFTGRRWSKLEATPTPEKWNAALDTMGRFRIVIRSAGVASAETNENPYRYFEAFPDAEGVAYVDALTATDEVTAKTQKDAAAKDVDERGPHHPRFMSGNAITLSGDIQAIIRFHGDPDTIHENYDFVHCTCYYSSWDNELVLPQAALEAILTKELRYVGSLYPLCSIIRIRKFVARGWWINAGQILKMCMHLNELDLKDISVLEDQLTGVDAAYFMQIIARLQQKQEEKIKALMEKDPKLSRTQAEDKTGNIDSTYLTTIIDKIF